MPLLIQGQLGHSDGDRHVAISPLSPHTWPATCLQSQRLVGREGTCSFQGWFALPVLSQQGWHGSESRLLVGPGGEATCRDSLTGVGGTGCHRRGGTVQEGVPFPMKRSQGRWGDTFFSCPPPSFSLSHSPPPRNAARQQAGVSVLSSHVLPPPPTRACRGHSRHAPAVLERRKQIGLPAGVQGAGRPWLASHHCWVVLGCGERRGRGTGWRGPTWRWGPCGKLGTTLVS